MDTEGVAAVNDRLMTMTSDDDDDDGKYGFSSGYSRFKNTTSIYEKSISILLNPPTYPPRAHIHGLS